MTLDAGYLPRISRSILLLLLLTVVAQASLRAQGVTASSGRDFWVALPSIALGPGYVVRLNITAVQSATVTVTLTENDSTITNSLNAGELWQLLLPRDLVMLDLAEQTSSRSIHITSTQPVTAHLVSDAHYVSEAFCALPTPSLGFEYLVMSAPSVGFPSDEPNNFGGVLAVVATQDGTELRITPTAMTTSGNPAGFTYGVSLDRGEVYQMLPRNPDHTDLTGTRITSNRPVGVLSGHQFLEFDSLDASNPLLEQMVPLVDWGRTFYAAPLPPGTHGHYRILASRAGTEVFVNGLRVATLGAGESRRMAVEGPMILRATAPILVAQHTTTFPATKGEPDSDPSMMLLNPVESYAESFIWGTSPLAPRVIPNDSLFVPFRQYAMITAPTNERGAVRLDGAPVNFTIPYNDGAYYSAVVQLAPGAHQLTAPAPINAQLYGNSLDDAYSLPAGVRLRDPFRAEPLFARTCRDVLDTTILLSNVGTEQIDVTDISFSPDTIASVISPDFVPINILPATSQLVRIRLSLPAYGSYSGTMTVTTATSGARPLVVPIEVTRDSLAIRVIESDIDFGDVTASRPTRDTTMRIINTGTGPVLISGASFSGPFSVISPQLPRWLAQGDTLALTIRFAPLGPGSSDGSVTITPVPCGDAVSATLHGIRLRSAAINVMAATAEPLVCTDPGYQDIPITIYNPGEEPLRIDSIGIAGGDAEDFFFPNSPDGTIVPASDSVTIPLRFRPRPLSYSNRTTGLRIWNPISPPGYFFVPVSARRDSFSITPSQQEIDFGVMNGCDSGKVQTITLRNSGNVPVTIDSTAITTDNFSLDGGTITLQPDVPIDLTIRFAPTEMGEHRDTLRLFDALCRTVTEIVLIGEQRVAELSVESDTLDVGVIASCVLPIEQALRLLNSGGVELSITSITTTGDGVGIVSLSDSTLSPSQSLAIPIVLLPRADGAFQSTITVRAEPCALERQVVVRGTIQTPALSGLNDIDLGELVAGQPSSGTTTLFNPGNLPLRLDSIVLVPDVAELRITAPSLPVVIGEGDSVVVEFVYQSAQPGDVDATATLHIDQPCRLQPTFAVRGRGQEVASIVLTLPDTAAPVDAHIGLPIGIRGAEEVEGNLMITGEVRWNYTMLDPGNITTSVAGATVTLLRDTVMGTERIVSFRYAGPIPRDTLLATLDLLVLLGTGDTTGVRWGNVVVQLNESTPSIEADDGSFTTLGICRIRGDRFIRLHGVISAARVVPNPATTTATLDVTAVEPTSCTFRIIDHLGREAASPLALELGPGRQVIPLDLHLLASGVYFYEIDTADRAERGRFVILR